MSFKPFSSRILVVSSTHLKDCFNCFAGPEMSKLWMLSWPLRNACAIDQLKLCFSDIFHEWMYKYLPGELVLPMQASVSGLSIENGWWVPGVGSKPAVPRSRGEKRWLRRTLTRADGCGAARESAECGGSGAVTVGAELLTAKGMLWWQHRRACGSERQQSHCRVEPWVVKARYKTRRGRNSKVS